MPHRVSKKRGSVSAAPRGSRLSFVVQVCLRHPRSQPSQAICSHVRPMFRYFVLSRACKAYMEQVEASKVTPTRVHQRSRCPYACSIHDTMAVHARHFWRQSCCPQCARVEPSVCALSPQCARRTRAGSWASLPDPARRGERRCPALLVDAPLRLRSSASSSLGRCWPREKRVGAGPSRRPPARRGGSDLERRNRRRDRPRRWWCSAPEHRASHSSSGACENAPSVALGAR